MKKITALLAGLCCSLFSIAQTITAAEYFVDADPGVGNGVPVSLTAGANVNFTASIPTVSLSNGFHFVGIRARDNTGKWGLYQSAGFYITTATSNVSNITAAEFFIDTDPGVGNGTPVPVTSGPTVNFAVNVPTVALSNGFHFLAIRTKDADGKWGLFETRGFYISTSTTNVSNIVAAEFIVDTDPGVGNGTAIPVSTGANISFVATVPTTSLPGGFHFLAIRTRDADGRWGMFETRGFYISTSTTNVSNIVAAEFFVDSDPGVGNGTAITVTPGANINFVATIPTTSLSNGFHFLAIRTKDADGKWGMFEKSGFYINAASVNVGPMVAAEYFIDTDPGVGNATPFTIPGGNSFSQNFALTIPGGTPNGQHFLAIRVKNEVWGLFDFDTLTVDGALPLTLLSFDAQKRQSSVRLSWKTTDEVNTSHFELEKSSNGISFNRIATIASINSPGVHEYAYDDLQPNDGLNFYRLRQIDIDAHFKYSQIVRVLFNSYGKPLNIYPNPAAQFVQFDFSGRQKTVLINVYDATGRQVISTSLANQAPMKLNIGMLAGGRYNVQLSDGETVQAGSFIKE